MSQMMNQAALVKCVADASSQTQETVRNVLGSLVATVKEQLQAGQSVRITDLGTFAVKQTNARPGHNPKTHEAIQIPARKIAVFKTVPSFRNMLS